MNCITGDVFLAKHFGLKAATKAHQPRITTSIKKDDHQEKTCFDGFCEVKYR
jgi:hypothetical protein